jgi:hypothetical protein
MRKSFLLAAILIVAVSAAVVILAQTSTTIQEFLTGYEEVPAVSTVASADFRAVIGSDNRSIQYQLTYFNLEGAPLQAHIHFGQTSVNGGIVVWLCGNPPAVSPPPGTQLCPNPPATIFGTLRPSDVVATANAQGIAPGEFEELIRAIQAGKTYVNIHSTKFPGGEVRSQIEPEGFSGGGHH